MPGESPLNMMRRGPQPVRRPPAGARTRRRQWRLLALVAIVIGLALGWSGLWYYAASVTHRTLSGWLEREAAAGRSYTCGSQTIGGFPLRIDVNCVDAAGEITSTQPPFAVSAKGVTFAAQVFNPTLLTGDFTGPLSLAEPGQPPSYIVNWSRAQLGVSGIPPNPDSASVTLDAPRLDQFTGPNSAMLFQADHAEVGVRITAGSARDRPVLEALVRFAAAVAPTVHPLLADPLKGDVQIVLRGLKDLLPKPWPERFREMQAADGNIEIKYLRVERPDAIIVGAGTLTLNEHGGVDGLIRVAVVGVEHIIPLLGVDQLIGQGLDRLTGNTSQAPQGLGALDRLVPGLSGVVRQNANASVIESIKKMGQPTEIDKKPAILLPLRVSNGLVSLGIIPLAQLPPLF